MSKGRLKVLLFVCLTSFVILVVHFLLTTKINAREYKVNDRTVVQYRKESVLESTNGQTLLRRIGSLGIASGKLKSNRKLILLITNMRSGSTFLGKLFDANEKVLHVFEPFWPEVDDLGRRWSATDDRKIGLLQSFSTCHFDSPSALTFLAELSSGRRQWTRYYSTALSSATFCHDTHLQVKQPEMNTNCSFSPTAMQQTCLSKQAVVLKVIRLANISRVESVHEHAIIRHQGMSHTPAEFHILHLVRDPRGTIHSRMKIGRLRREYQSYHPNEQNVGNEAMVEFSANRLCKQISYTLSVGESRLPWILGKYFRVRFEDIALHPVVQMTELFHHYDMEMKPEVLHWIQSNTHGAALHSQPQPRQSLQTNRNSTLVVDSWRILLKSAKGRKYVDIIEKQCSDVMRHLRYDLAM